MRQTSLWAITFFIGKNGNGRLPVMYVVCDDPLKCVSSITDQASKRFEPEMGDDDEIRLERIERDDRVIYTL